MTREEKLDWLYRLRSEIYVYMPKEWLIPMNNALDMAIKAPEQEPKWIPVSERLPEYGKEVLTCSNGGFIEIQSREGTYGYWENQHGDWSVADEVIAWMPLPKPFEPQESEG